MTQEQKELLLKDLCSRLPYGVKVQVDLQSDIYSPIICKVCSVECSEIGSTFIGVETSPDTYNEFREFLCKPYLFPFSSMTEEQKKELNDITDLDIEIAISHIKNDTPNYVTSLNRLNWLLKNHFDIYDLIPVGLAEDATGKNIYLTMISKRLKLWWKQLTCNHNY